VRLTKRNERTRPRKKRTYQTTGMRQGARASVHKKHGLVFSWYRNLISLPLDCSGGDCAISSANGSRAARPSVDAGKYRIDQDVGSWEAAMTKRAQPNCINGWPNSASIGFDFLLTLQKSSSQKLVPVTDGRPSRTNHRLNCKYAYCCDGSKCEVSVSQPTVKQVRKDRHDRQK
jgi:hypothetical protein